MFPEWNLQKYFLSFTIKVYTCVKETGRWHASCRGNVSCLTTFICEDTLSFFPMITAVCWYWAALVCRYPLEHMTYTRIWRPKDWPHLVIWRTTGTASTITTSPTVVIWYQLSVTMVGRTLMCQQRQLCNNMRCSFVQRQLCDSIPQEHGSAGSWNIDRRKMSGRAHCCHSLLPVQNNLNWT